MKVCVFMFLWLLWLVSVIRLGLGVRVSLLCRVSVVVWLICCGFSFCWVMSGVVLIM